MDLFIGKEEERLVLPDGPAYCSAKLVLRIFRPWQTIALVQESVCIENLVSNVLIGRAVKLISAALGGHAHHAAGKAAELRTDAAGLDLELLNGVGCGHQGGGVLLHDHGGTAVDEDGRLRGHA